MNIMQQNMIMEIKECEYRNCKTTTFLSVKLDQVENSVKSIFLQTTIQWSTVQEESAMPNSFPIGSFYLPSFIFWQGQK